MTDIEMLPLPEPLPRVLVHVLHEGDMELEAVGNYYAAEQVRACVAHATAAKDAEIEALRAEVERQKQWLSFWGSFASRQSTLAEQAEARAERLAEALRELVELKDNVKHTFPTDYEARKPLAWEAARAALRGHDQEVGNG